VLGDHEHERGENLHAQAIFRVRAQPVSFEAFETSPQCVTQSVRASSAVTTSPVSDVPL
jgi:hypothetical protein